MTLNIGVSKHVCCKTYKLRLQRGELRATFDEAMYRRQKEPKKDDSPTKARSGGVRNGEFRELILL